MRQGYAIVNQYRLYSGVKNFYSRLKEELAKLDIKLLLCRTGEAGLAIQDNGKVTSQAITGKEVDGQYIVTAGLTAGQKVVSNPDGDLKEGEQLP